MDALLLLLVVAVAAQRLAELAYARINERRLRALGAVEHGRRHYPLFFVLHGGWLLAILVAVPRPVSVEPVPLILFLALVPLRLWTMASLGRFWTTRVLTLPGAPLSRKGPYRWVRHPNYMIVAAEIALLPLAFGAWTVAVAFSLANALLLAHRIRVEERALAGRP